MKTLAGVVACGAEAHVSDKAGRALDFGPNRCGGRSSGADAAQNHRVSVDWSSAARAMETTKGSAHSNETAEANSVSPLSCRLGISVSSTLSSTLLGFEEWVREEKLVSLESLRGHLTEQLSAFASRLASDEAPNADFIVFSPSGRAPWSS